MQGSIDLSELIRLLMKRLWLIVLVSVIGFLVAFGYTKIILTPMYTSSIKLYVSNTQTQGTDQKINYSDISAAQQLVNTYAVIVQSNQVLNEVASSVDLPYTAAQLRGMLSVQSVNETEVMEIFVTSNQPQKSADIANAIGKVAPGQIKKITGAGYVELVDAAIPLLAPTSPNTNVNCFVGFAMGLALAVLYVIMREMFDMHIKGEDDIKKHYNVPMLGSIPAFHAQQKGGYSDYER